MVTACDEHASMGTYVVVDMMLAHFCNGVWSGCVIGRGGIMGIYSDGCGCVLALIVE